MRDRLLLPAILLTALSAACAGAPDAGAVAADGAASCGGAGLESLAAARRLAPLTAADVDRYLRVMGDAAARRAAPTAEDRALLARADSLQERALTAGLAATPEAAIAANTLMSQADTLRRHLDVVVVRAQGADAGCWAVLRDRVEAVVPLTGPDGTTGIYGDESDAVGQAAPDDDAPEEGAEDAALRRHLEVIRGADSLVVTPRRAAIADVLRAVRG